MTQEINTFKPELYDFVMKCEIIYFSEKIQNFLKSKNISFKLVNNIISFKYLDNFFKISVKQNNYNLLYFGYTLFSQHNNGPQFQLNPDIILNNGYSAFQNLFFSTSIIYSKINFYNINNYYILIWEDEEESFNLLDLKTLYNLFKDLNTYYSYYLIKNMSLKDIYFSKTLKKFVVKDFVTFIPGSVWNVPNIIFTPKNILFNKFPFKNNEKDLSFEEIINLSPEKNQLKEIWGNNEIY